MSTKMRQVCKEEFEILTRFHPGEIRYYVDVGKALNTRHKGAKVSVTRKPVKKKVAKKGAKRASPQGINGRSGKVNNAAMLLGTHAPSFRENSKSESWWRLVKLQFHNDPTFLIGRTDLVNTIVSGSPYTTQQIGPFVSDCIRRGFLRYKPIVAAVA